MAERPGFGGKGITLVAISWTQVATATILVAIRGYAASRINGRWRWDFIWIVLAWIMGIGAQAALHIAALNGLGQQRSSLTRPQIVEALRWTWYCIFIGLPAVVLLKFSITALLLQVQGPYARKRNWALWGMGALVGLTCVVQLSLTLFECKPTAKLWNPTLPGYCPSRRIATQFNKFQGAVGALTDLALALWPISIVWNLNTSMRVKVGFCLLMAVAILPTIAVIARLILLPKIGQGGNPTWDFTDFMYWAVSELWAGVILSSIPPLRPLFLRVFYGGKSTASCERSRAGTIGNDLTKGGNSIALHTMDDGKTGFRTATTTTTTTTVNVDADASSEDGVLMHHHIDQIQIRRDFVVKGEIRQSLQGRV